MTDIENTPPVDVPPSTVGQQLRAARERAGMTIAQVAGETRISRDNLENIEAGNFAKLPARAYALGFAKTYAKVVGLDQADVAALVSAEMAGQETDPRPRQQTFEPGDPARVPSAGLGWLSAVAIVLLLVGLFFAARLLFAPAAEMPSLIEQEQQQPKASQAGRTTAQQTPVATPTGPVVFTALEEVWVKFYDAQGNRLMESEMAKGDSYTVPADAVGPQVLTGRPNALAITIGGKPVPKLSEELVTVADVPVSAAALLARPEPVATPATQASPTN